MLNGQGYEDRFLTEPEIGELMKAALGGARLEGRRVLVIIPDSTPKPPRA